MYRSLVAVMMVVGSVHLEAADAQSQKCSQLAKMVECFPDIRKYLDRPINLTMVVMITGADQNTVKRCQNVSQFLTCLDDKMRNCREVTDSTDQTVRFWQNFRVGINYLCSEQREVFVRHQTCLSSAATRQATLACDSGDAHRRRRRHSCDDYNGEIRCLDKAVNDKCGTEAARHVGHFARIYLKSTTHTKDCTAPEFKVVSGAAIGVITSPLLLSAAYLATTMFLS